MSVQADTVIQFSGLKSGFYEFGFDLGKEFFERFENDDLRDGNVHFEVHLERKERLLLFNISFDGFVMTQCDRCLGDLSVSVTGKHLLTVRIHDNETSDNEDVVILPEKAISIDLAQFFYEYVVIALPMQHVHPDDEHGIPTCDPSMLRFLSHHDEPSDHDESAPDPRWAKLLDLK